ncbi:hypothetical protein QL093DRAFT_2590155 [Fusarium oxysporum]|nr:hypothetical protein QL093DRAFT_2590155 [Fusarium oxysporum]
MDQPILALTPIHNDVSLVRNALRRCLSNRLKAEDVTFLELFSRILIGRKNCPDEISRTLERGIDLEWEDVYDLVNPFGDTRGRSFNSVWTFDLDKDVLFLKKHDKLCSAPLSLARDRLLTLDDFELVRSPTEEIVEEITVPAPYWDLQLDVDQRKKALLGRILRDFVERTGFEHVGGRGGRYAPDKAIVQVGSRWFVLARDIRKGLAMIREHMGSLAAIAETTTGTASYAILTLRQIVCCKVHDGDLVYTRPEPLFSDTPSSDSAIDLILFVSDIHQVEPKPCRLNCLPVEIQDRILLDAATRSFAAAKLAAGQRRKIKLEVVLRHQTEASPVESQIVLNGVMSSLPYKCEAVPIGFKVDRSSLPAPPRLTVAVPSPYSFGSAGSGQHHDAQG